MKEKSQTAVGGKMADSMARKDDKPRHQKAGTRNDRTANRARKG
jgi:hypothetical protein